MSTIRLIFTLAAFCSGLACIFAGISNLSLGNTTIKTIDSEESIVMFEIVSRIPIEAVFPIMCGVIIILWLINYIILNSDKV